MIQNIESPKKWKNKNMLHLPAITTQKMQAAKLRCVNWCCRVKLILSRVKLILPAIRKKGELCSNFQGCSLQFLEDIDNVTSSSQLGVNNLPDHCYHLGMSEISFSDVRRQRTHVVFMLYSTEYVPEDMFVVNGENNIVYFGHMLWMSVSEHTTHPLFNGPCNRMQHV